MLTVFDAFNLREQLGTVTAYTATDPIITVDRSRFDIPRLCKRLGFERGAEIGVWRGGFSATFLKAGLEMTCVDAWAPLPGWLDTKHVAGDVGVAMLEEAYAAALAELAPFADRCTVLRMTSADAAMTVPDGSLDFVYIDADHSYGAVHQDLGAWSRKVRPGGLIAGHDYRKFENKPTIHVVEAVTDYTTERGIRPIFILAADRTPSFLWVQS
jgi:hypothetical protein